MKIPDRYRGHGLYIWCNTCNKVVSKNPCNHSRQHRYQSRLWNKATRRTDIIKTWQETDIKKAFALHTDFKKQLQLKFNQSHAYITVESAGVDYLDYLQDINVPDFKAKNLSKQYITDQFHYIKRFFSLLKESGIQPSSIFLHEITDHHVGLIHAFFQKNEYSKYTYNAQMNAIRYMIEYFKDQLPDNFINPFKSVRRKRTVPQPEIITDAEFQILLDCITPENGWSIKGTKQENVNYYRSWLKDYLIISLLIGERAQGISALKWSDVKENHIAIPNHKSNNRENTDHHYSYTPITLDLAEMLLKLKPNKDDEYLLVPDWKNRKSLYSLLALHRY